MMGDTNQSQTEIRTGKGKVLEVLRRYWPALAGGLLFFILIAAVAGLSGKLRDIRSELENDLQAQESVIKSQEDAIAELKKKIDTLKDLKSKVDALDAEKPDYEALKQEVVQVKKKAFGNDLSHFVSAGVVTERFVINNAIFWIDDDRLKGIVDILPQAAFEKEYEGKGRYKLPEEELKTELDRLINKIEDVYILLGSRYDWTPAFSQGVFSITTSNYKTATYDSDKIMVEK